MQKTLRKFIACSLALLMCLGSVAFAGAEETTAISISATETTTIQTLDCTFSGGQNNGGNCQLFEGGYITATLDVAEEGYYTLDGKLQNRAGYYGIWDIYVNDMATAYDSFRVWGEAGTFFEGNVADIYLNKGVNTVKFQPVKVGTNSVNVFFNEFSLTKKAIASKAIWVYAEAASDIGGQSGKYGTSQGMAYLNRNGGGTPYPYAEYSITIPEGESGIYEISLQHTWNQYDLSPYSVTVNGEEISAVTALPAVPRTNTQVQYANTQYVSPMCQAFLNDGANTIRITNMDAGGQLLYLSRVKFDKVKNVTEISATETTTIQTDDCDTLYGGMANHNNTTNYGFCTNAYVETSIFVEETGYYRLDVKNIVNGTYATYSVFIDETLEDTYTVWGRSAALDDEACDLYLSEGVHTLKIKYIEPASVYQYFKSFSLTKKERATKSIWINAVDVSDSTLYPNTQYYNMYNINSTQSAGYKVTVPVGGAGTYLMSMKVARADAAITNYSVEVNGALVGGTLQTIPATNSYQDSVPGQKQVIHPMCEINLKEGENTVIFTNKTSAFTYFSRLKFEKLSDDVSYDQRFHSRSYTAAYATQNELDTSQLGQDGSNIDNTKLQVGNWAEYSVTIEQPGWYDLGLTIGTPNNSAQIIKAYIDGTQAMMGSYTSDTTDYTQKDAVFGSVNFPEAKTYTLKIEKTDGNFAYFSYVFLKYTGAEPAKTEIASSGTTEINAIDYTFGFDTDKASNFIVVEAGKLSFGSGDFAEYYLDVKETGLYKLGVTAGYLTSGEPAYDVSVNGEFRLRQIAGKESVSEFPTIDSYIKLEEGTQILRFDNVGHPSFYFSKFALTYAGDIVTPTSADTSLSAYVTGGVSGPFDEIAVGVNAENAGVYRLNISTGYSEENAKVAVYDNNGLLNSKTLKVADDIANNTVFVNLNEGVNVLTIKNVNGDNGYFEFEDITIAKQTAADADTLNALISDVEGAVSADELKEIITENEAALGVDYDALTGDIQYDEYALIRLLNRSYIDATDFYGALYDAADAETESPSVTSSLAEDGTLTVTAETDIYDADGTFVVAVYNYVNGAKQLKGINYIPYTKGEKKTLTVTDCSESYEVKFLAFNAIDKLEPITLANGVYANIYVAPNGNDNAEGTEDAPFLTLARAKEEVASLQSSMTGDIVVNIAPGYYELSETEVFDETHGGVNDYKVIYKGTDENKASVIGGGKKVTGWTDTDGDGIYSASFTGSDVRDLYVNGYPAVRARSDMFEATERNEKILTADIGNLTFSKPAELITVWFTEWSNHYVGVEALTKSGTTATITLSDKANISTNTNGIELYENETSAKAWCDWHNKYHKSFYIENALELLNEEGEFYYDGEGTIYYKPYSEENLADAEVYASQIESLMAVSGTNNENQVTNIVFDNLSFRYSTWNNNEIRPVQATQYVKNYADGAWTYGEIPSQIVFNQADGVEITNCEFACLGSNALSLCNAVTNAKISGNVFRDLSGGAMVIGSFNHEHEAADGETCSDIEISDNVIRRTSLIWRGMPSVTVYYEKNVDIVRNDISEVSYSGLSLGWGWGNTTAKFGNFKVANNKIYAVMQNMTDGGHIYTLGDMPGTVIENNYLYGSLDGRGGVYNDSGSGNIDILNNVVDVYKSGTSYWWFPGVYKTHDLYADGNFSHSKNDWVDRPDSTNNVYGNNNNIASAGSWDGAGNATAQAIIDNAGVSSEFKTLITEAALPSWRTNPLVTP